MTTPATVSFTVRMPSRMVADLDKRAKASYSSRNREIIVAVRAHLDASEKREGR